jgi:anion-transporting  ArsA/GET3 family ATPase
MAAMMLDQKGAWDRLVERHAPSAEARDRVYANAFYQSLSQTFAGSYEYMAIEELMRLYEDGRYDLIVVDTPPTKHALDFLRAPRKLTDFLDGSVLKWFVMPYFKAGRFGLNLASRMAARVLEWLEELFGLEFLRELNEFFRAFEALYAGFKDRAESVDALLRREDLAAFLLVTAPTREMVQDATYFLDQLRAHGLPVGGAIANRVHPAFCGAGGGSDGGSRPAPLALALDSDEGLARLEADLDAVCPAGAADLRSALKKAVLNFCGFELLAAADRRHLAPLAERLAREGLVYAEVPAFDQDVYDLAGLERLNRGLFPAPRTAEAPRGDGG